jgi:hypothetical protein
MKPTHSKCELLLNLRKGLKLKAFGAEEKDFGQEVV